MHACMHACMYAWMDGWMDGWICACMCVCIYNDIFSYVYMYIYIYVRRPRREWPTTLGNFLFGRAWGPWEDFGWPFESVVLNPITSNA